MNCEQAKELFPDALVGSLNDSVRTVLEAHMRRCASCREEAAGLHSIWEKLAALPEEEPGATLDCRVHATIDAYRSGLKVAGHGVGRRRPMLLGWLWSLWPKQTASQVGLAILLFALGLLLGPQIIRQKRYDAGTFTGDQSSLTQLHEEIASMKQLLTLSLLQQPSASERLRGVGWTSRLEQPDEQVLSVLLRVLELDPNVNVRLAAVEALQPFVQNPRVRKGLIDALAHSESPLVQIDLIHAMVRANERDSVAVLQALLKKVDIDPNVRELAEWALQKLS